MTMAATTPKVAGTIRSKNPLKGAVEILPERLYFAALKAPPPSHNILASTPRRSKTDPPSAKKQIHFFNVDNELVYWNFFLDFGPLNLGQFTRFSNKLNDKLRKFPVVCFYSSTVPAKRANAIFLICAYQLVYLSRSPETAYRGFDKLLQQQIVNTDASVCSQPPVSNSQGSVTIAPLPPWHDASPCACTYDLTVFDCLKGMAKAMSHGFYVPNQFDVEEYEHFEQVENGDLNWLVKDKILAFAGPSFERHVSPEGYCTLSPNDYIPYFLRKNVGLVVRLNKRCYNEQDFVNAGIKHVDAFFLDGSCPPMKILMKVVAAFEACAARNQAFAVHCKAGLGRTGTCIGAYLMKHYRFTASEVIAWMRICRPGCVIGPQQHFLKQIEQHMWQEGEAEGCIERPIHVVSSSQDEDEDVEVDDTYHVDGVEVMDTEAIEGRAGQAEALLSARVNRSRHGQPGPGANASSALEEIKDVEVSNLVTPMTPEQPNKDSVLPTVTPDGRRQQQQLWCS